MFEERSPQTSWSLPHRIAPARPTTIGRYVVVGSVGKGAMGEVYAAYDPELNRKVAIKMLRSIPGDETEVTQLRLRMMREAQAIAKVSHPNVVVVHDVGTYEDQVFVAMEFVEGHTLSYWLVAETRPWPDVLKIFIDAGRGLAAAHEKDLVHRDFKPDNVMIAGDGQVRVMDFGLARTVDKAQDKRQPDSGPNPAPVMPLAPLGSGPRDAVGATVVRNAGRPLPADTADVDATRALNSQSAPGAGSRSGDPASDVMRIQITRTGAIMGTPAYMAPEQFLRRDTDARTDQFSFCVALYEGIYGQRPFEGRTFQELEANVLGGVIREPASKKGVPPGLRKVLLRGLQVDPQQRWPSMKALLASLEDSRLFAGRRRLVAGAAAKLSGVWEAPVRGRPVHTPAKAEMRKAFLATGKPYAASAFENASRILDRYAQSWSDMYVDICEATHVRGEQSAEVLDLRMAALLDCLEGLRALARIFMQANGGVVENAVSAASALGGLERCADIAALRAGVRPPGDKETRAAVDKLRARLAEVRALGRVGRYIDGLKAIEPLAEEVRRVGYRPLLAETLLELGKLHIERRNADVASRVLEEALWAAELSRHEEVVAEAASYLVFAVGEIQGRFDAAEIWSRHAEITLERMGGHETLWGWLFNNRGAVREKQGRLTDALDDAIRAVAAKEKAGGANTPDVAISLNNLALWMVQLGEVKQAMPHIERALSIVEKELGLEHPGTALILSNTAEILNVLGRFQEARGLAARALTIFERETEPDGSPVTFPLTALGIACLGLGLVDEALPILERSATIRDLKESDSARLGEVHFALARALVLAGRDIDRAWQLAERARSEYAFVLAGPATQRELAKIESWLAKGRPAS